MGNKYHLYDENKNPLFFIDRPVFKLKAHICIYTDESKSTKVLTLFDVADAARSLDRHIVVGMCILLDNAEKAK